jgi:hypothetical protein
MNDVLTWRKEFGANSLVVPKKLAVSEEFFKKGGIFQRNHDKNGTPIIHIIVKLHKKDNFPHAEICRAIAYFFEKNYKFSLNSPCVLLLDCADAGYSNLVSKLCILILTELS